MSGAGAAPDPGGASTARILVWYWLPVAAYVGMIFSLSSIHGDKIPTPFPNVDKLEHLMEYGLLGLLLGRAIRFTLRGGSNALASVATVAGGATIALLDELYQRRVPGRMSDPLDWLTDVAALVAAVLFTRFVHTRPLWGGRGRGAAGAGSGEEAGGR